MNNLLNEIAIIIGWITSVGFLLWFAGRVLGVFSEPFSQNWKIEEEGEDE